MFKKVIKSLCLSFLLLAGSVVFATQQATEIDSAPVQPVKKQVTRTPVPLNYWVHFAPETAGQFLAAYGEFFNVSDKPIYLTSVRDNDFERVELHTLDEKGNDIEATHKSLLLPPMGGSVKLQYGGNYILLIKPKKKMLEGSKTTLTLYYRVGGSDEQLSQDLLFTVTANGTGCGVIPPGQ
ncbi:MAG: hypothetical protein CR975_00440 [Gammaproteobacteria bacterium]|nr:MAG: hypothetical protein CR975_00440 [Gammaproteobacteria bacterium]